MSFTTPHQGILTIPPRQAQRAIPMPNMIAGHSSRLMGEAEESAPRVFRATIFYFHLQQRAGQGSAFAAV